MCSVPSLAWSLTFSGYIFLDNWTFLVMTLSPYCGAYTYREQDGICVLCKHKERVYIYNYTSLLYILPCRTAYNSAIDYYISSK
jgi:hypothetical protein